jgi:hypothetical protein
MLPVSQKPASSTACMDQKIVCVRIYILTQTLAERACKIDVKNPLEKGLNRARGRCGAYLSTLPDSMSAISFRMEIRVLQKRSSSACTKAPRNQHVALHYTCKLSQLARGPAIATPLPFLLLPAMWEKIRVYDSLYAVE